MQTLPDHRLSPLECRCAWHSDDCGCASAESSKHLLSQRRVECAACARHTGCGALI